MKCDVQLWGEAENILRETHVKQNLITGRN